MNPFAITMVVLNICAAIMEFKRHNPYWGGVYICYGIASLLIALAAKGKT